MKRFYIVNGTILGREYNIARSMVLVAYSYALGYKYEDCGRRRRRHRLCHIFSLRLTGAVCVFSYCLCNKNILL